MDHAPPPHNKPPTKHNKWGAFRALYVKLQTVMDARVILEGGGHRHSFWHHARFLATLQLNFTLRPAQKRKNLSPRSWQKSSKKNTLYCMEPPAPAPALAEGLRRLTLKVRKPSHVLRGALCASGGACSRCPQPGGGGSSLPPCTGPRNVGMAGGCGGCGECTPSPPSAHAPLDPVACGAQPSVQASMEDGPPPKGAGSQAGGWSVPPQRWPQFLGCPWRMVLPP